MLLEEGVCEKMMEHFILMRRIEKNWKAHMSKIMNEENEWDQIVDAVEGPIGRSDERRDNGGVQILEDWKGTWANRCLC